MRVQAGAPGPPRKIPLVRIPPFLPFLGGCLEAFAACGARSIVVILYGLSF